MRASRALGRSPACRTPRSACSDGIAAEGAAAIWFPTAASTRLVRVDERKRRLVENENLFREVNERIEKLAATLHGPGPFGFLCECSNRDCERRVTLTLADYEAVRAQGDRFLVAPGHVLPDIERVVESHEEYEVVDKDDDVEAIARARDPRVPLQ